MKDRFDGMVVILFLGGIAIAFLWGLAALFALVSEGLEAFREWLLGSPLLYFIIALCTLIGLLIGASVGGSAKKSGNKSARGPAILSALVGMMIPLLFMGCGWLLFDLLGVKAANALAAWCGYVFHHDTENWKATIIVVLFLLALGYIMGGSAEYNEGESARSGET